MKRWRGSLGGVLPLGMEEPNGLVEWAAANVPEAMREDPIRRLAAYRVCAVPGGARSARHSEDSCKPQDAKSDRSVDPCCRIDQCEYRGGLLTYVRRGTGEVFRVCESSAREAREWLFEVRHALNRDVTTARIALATRIMKILTIAIKRERAQRQTRARRHSRDLQAPTGDGPARPTAETTLPTASVSQQPAPQPAASL